MRTTLTRATNPVNVVNPRRHPERPTTRAVASRTRRTPTGVAFRDRSRNVSSTTPAAGSRAVSGRSDVSP